MTGTVIFYDSKKGFGFIRQDNSTDNMFFHITKCNITPEAEMRVQYDIAEGRKGLEAVNVNIIW